MSGDAVDVVARLKQESAVPLRSHGSLMAALVTRLADHLPRLRAYRG